MKELEKYIGKKVVVRTRNDSQSYKGILYSFDMSKHGGIGNVILEVNSSKILINGIWIELIILYNNAQK
ncbi:MAG TPA: hypothetical protein ENG45_00310 [Candidatus Aenigmarchaeota archaeon]|nr:hypothetical protein [Candidatus Aenigmarchaeota archaeon]